jgi:hypothetical protein
VLSRRDETDGAAHVRVAHLAQRIEEIGVPVPHPDIRRQRHALGRKPRLQPFGLPHRQRGNRGDAAKVLVVLGYGVDPVGRDPPAPEDVRQERPDVGQALGTAEGDDEHGVEGHGAPPS